MKKFFALWLSLMLVSAGLSGCAAPVTEDEGPGEEEQRALIQKTAEEIVLPVAEAYGIDDMRFVEYDPEDYYGTCTFASDKYAKLPWEEQLGLLTDPVLAVYEEKPFPEETVIADKEFDLVIVSGEDVYTDFTAKGQSELRINGKTYGEMPTLYSMTVAQDLADTMARVDRILETTTDEALLEIELRRKMNDPGQCPVCGAQYREGTSPSKMIQKYGYCRSLCRSRLEELMEENP